MVLSKFEEDKAKQSLLEMMSKGTYDRKRLLPLLASMDIDQEYKASILSLLSPAAPPADPNELQY